MDYTQIANEIETAQTEWVEYKGMRMTRDEYIQMRESEQN